MNTTTTEKMLQDAVRDIRRMLADLGILCNECNQDIQEELAGAKEGLKKADTAVSYALLLKKNARRSGEL